MAVQPSNSEQKVNVFIRVRPLIQREKDEEETVNWHTDDKVIQQYQPGTKKLLLTAAPYAFDQIFSESATTENVYETAVAPIVEKSLQGYNGTVLCYGQTSSGKTHTMYGSEDEPGIIFLAAQDLFRRFGDDSRSYFVKIGLVEVYNEKLTDLLDPEKKQIGIYDVDGEAVPKDLRQIDVYSPEDMLDAARRVQKERRIGETRMNKESSRSHTILRIIIQSTPNDDSKDRQMTNALLNFVDLAGSEKADQSGAVGDRLREATYINRSLTTLSKVVNQLSGLPTPSHAKSSATASSTVAINTATSNQNLKQTSEEPFVSYRDSKLTRILKSSLSGNAYIALICNMTPASVEETHSTLGFASRAKCIKVDPTKNLGPVTASEYNSKIQDLEKQLNEKSAEADRLRKQLAAFTKFVRPNMDFCNSPAQLTAQQDRRRTICPSMLPAHRTGILADHGPGDEFKVPKSPVRRPLMPTPAANNPLPSIPPLAGNNPPQRSELDKSLDINGNNVLDEPGPPPAKLANVDAQTWTEFSPLTELQFPPPATRKSRESLHSELTTVQEALEVIRSAATGSTDHLSKQCKALQCENESLRAERRAHLLETDRMELEHQQVTFKYTKSVDMLCQLEEELAGVKKAKDLLEAELDSAAQVAQALSELKKKCEHLETQIKKLEAEKKAHSAIIADLTREKETFAAQIQRLQLDLEDKKALKKELEETKSLVGQLEKLQPQIHELQQGIVMKATEIEDLKTKLRQSETSLEIMRTQLASESQSKVDELQLQIQTLQAQVYGEKSGSATLMKTNQQLSERQKTLQSDLEELKTRYNLLQFTAESANQKISTLEQTVATLEARLAQAQQDRPRVSKRSVGTQVVDTMNESEEFHIFASGLPKGPMAQWGVSPIKRPHHKK